MFLTTTCQIGSEKPLKTELLREFPLLRFAFSRPGFLTFKITDENRDPLALADSVRNGSVFARYVGVSLGKIVTDSPVALAEQLETFERPEKIKRVHFWNRDKYPVGEKGFEPLPLETDQVLERRIADSVGLRYGKARSNELVLDCTQIDPDLYWIGYHRAADERSRFPGGLFPLEIPTDMVSRAWLKFTEALRWSGLPIGCGTCCADIGSSPGGASQVLLTRGAEVLGVDPAEMDPRILKYPNFTHIRGRIGQVKRSLFRKVRYVIADMNVAPNFTLDVLEELVSRRDNDIRGLLFTLKMFQIELADSLPEYAERIRNWGFSQVQMKQLQFNRQEVMVAGSK
ncbi:MAG: SAM-dependent methyltransferase [Planctomycetaceae bacterium]|nr:SAM-dependent methyltransferase [Planctomycetaceae bacterium]